MNGLDVPFPSNKESVCLTAHNNLMYYDDDEGDAVICCYGLFAHKLVQKIKVSDLHADGSNSINPNESFSQVKVTRLVLSQDNKSYFIGYEDGLVQEISAIDLQLIETWKKGK